jgi:hypothetical protein
LKPRPHWDLGYLQQGIRGNRNQGRSGPKRPETFKACQEFTQFFPQRGKVAADRQQWLAASPPRA